MTRHLRRSDPLGQRAERLRLRIPGVPIQPGPVDRPPVQPWRCPRLQPAERQTQSPQPPRQPNRRRLPNTTCRSLPLPDVDHAPQKSPGRQHDRPTRDPRPVAANHRLNPPARPDLQILSLAGPNSQPRHPGQQPLHRPLVQLRSACARGPRTAGPLLRFSILK